MARWQPDARGRLQKSALDLFGERGFNETTVAEIAEHSGLTKRTFFRHFADKREVLFGGTAELEELFVSSVGGAPGSASPMQAMASGLDAAADMFEGRREFAALRQKIIVANPDLQERELTKLQRLAAAVAEALRGRGIGDPSAVLTAEAGITVFRVAFERWVADGESRGFRKLIDESMDELRDVTAAI